MLSSEQIILSIILVLLFLYLIFSTKKNIRTVLTLISSIVIISILIVIEPRTIKNLVIKLNHKETNLSLIRFQYTKEEVSLILEQINNRMNSILNSNNLYKERYKSTTFKDDYLLLNKNIKEAKFRLDYLRSDLDFLLLSIEKINNEEYFLSLEYIYRGLTITNNKKTRSYLNMLLAYSLINLEKFDNAEEVIKQLILFNPKNYYGYRLYGIFYTEKGNFELANVNFKKALELNPNNEKVKYSYSWSLYQQGKLKEAEDILKNLKDNASKYTLLGNIYQKRSKFLESIKYYKKVLNINNNDLYANSHIAYSYFKLKDNDKSKKFLEKAIKNNTKDFYNYELKAILTKNIKEQKKLYLKALTLNPKASTSHLNLSNIYLLEKDFENFLKHITSVNVDERNNLSMKYNNFGFGLEQLNIDKVIEFFYKKSLELDEKNNLAYLNYGVFLKNKKRNLEAKKLYLKALKYFPNDARIYNNMSTLVYDKSESIKLLRKAIELDENYYMAYDNLCFYLKGKEKQKVCNKAKELKNKFNY